MTEEQRERLKQIRERLATHRVEVDKYRSLKWAEGDALRYYKAPDDVDFLLSLLNSQAVSIPYCLNCWHAVPHNGPAGTVDDACTHEGCNCGYYQPAPLNDTATAMCDACVEKVLNAARASSNSADYSMLLGLANELRSLTLDQVEQEKTNV